MKKRACCPEDKCGQPGDLPHGAQLPRDYVPFEISEVVVACDPPHDAANLRIVLYQEGQINAVTRLTIDEARPLFRALGARTDDWIGCYVAIDMREPKRELLAAKMVPSGWEYRVVRSANDPLPPCEG